MKQLRKWLLLPALLVSIAPAAMASEVSSMTACKPDGAAWLCATWKDNRMSLFRSSRYLSNLELSGEVEGGVVKGGAVAAVQAAMPAAGSATPGVKAASPVSASGGEYTLQLLACNNERCSKRMQKFVKIPQSRIVEIKNDNQLWQVLLVGHYGSIKSAQQAAAALISQYQLKDKPWVRTLASIERRLVKP